MKFTRSFTFILLSALFSSAFAQEDEGHKFRFGLKVQPNFCWLKPEQKFVSNEGIRMGFGYGVIAEYRFTPNYAFATEVLINTINGKMRYDSLYFQNPSTNSVDRYTNIDYYYNIRYVQVPLTLKMQTKEIGYFRYYGQIGLGVGILYNAKSKVKGGPSDLTDFTNVKDTRNSPTYRDEINVFRPSIIIGAGTEYRFSGQTALNVGVRFDNGFLDIMKESKIRSINNTISLSVGIIF